MLPNIYMITDTRNGMRLIGKSNGNFKYYFTGSVRVNNIIRKNGGMGEARKFLKKETIVEGNFNPILLNELEKHYIRLYNTKKPYGYNLTDGGDGWQGIDKEILKAKAERFRGYRHTDEAKRKMSLVHKGKKISDEQKLILRESWKGRAFSKEANAKRVATLRANGAFDWNDERRLKQSNALKGRVPWNRGVAFTQVHKKIDQYDLQGNFLKTWNSIKEAKDSFGGVRNGSISSAASGKKKTCYGFIWRYHGDGLGIRPIKIKNRKFSQFDLDGNFINEWESVTNAAKSVGFATTSICAVLNNRRNSCGGFKWRYNEVG